MVLSLVVWGLPPKNRYEHIHVRLAVAILGHRHFWEGGPTPPLRTSQIYLASEFGGLLQPTDYLLSV